MENKVYKTPEGHVVVEGDTWEVEFVFGSRVTVFRIDKSYTPWDREEVAEFYQSKEEMLQEIEDLKSGETPEGWLDAAGEEIHI